MVDAKTEKFITRSKSIHGDTFDYSKSVYIHTEKKITIICKIHGEFEQTPHDHLRGHGCADCFGNKKSNKTKFVEKSSIIHNNFYSYDKFVYKNSYTNGIITCPIHGDFTQKPNNHLFKHGCPECGKIKYIKTKSSNRDKFIEKSIKIHAEKWKYDKVVYINNYTDVTITCPLHGDFKQIPNKHLSGQGCPTCGGRNKTTEKVVNEFNTIHNNFYNYSKFVYKTALTKSIIICPFHGEFSQRPSDHLNGQGCPICIHRISKSEIEFLNYLNIKKENRQLTIKLYNIDGYIPETNTIVEFLGDYWHGNPKKFNHANINKVSKKTFGELYNNTFKRFEILKTLGYNIKYVWESDWLKFKKSIDNIPKIIDY